MRRMEMFKKNVVTTIFAMLISLSSTIPGFAGAVTGPQMLRNQIVGAHSSKVFTAALRGVRLEM
jgi:hypothetical protein